MLLYQDITQALTPPEQDVVSRLQRAALTLDHHLWEDLLKDPLIVNLLKKKILQIGTPECKL